jgi:hypothetical protein
MKDKKIPEQTRTEAAQYTNKDQRGGGGWRNKRLGLQEACDEIKNQPKGAQ